MSTNVNEPNDVNRQQGYGRARQNCVTDTIQQRFVPWEVQKASERPCAQSGSRYVDRLCEQFSSFSQFA
jgi:hypothetical protein